MSGGLASFCECDECRAIQVLTGICLSPELADLFVPLNVNPTKQVLWSFTHKRREDPVGFTRILWAWPLCGPPVDLPYQKKQQVANRDFAWLSKEGPTYQTNWNSYSDEILAEAEPEICAWLYVSRLIPSIWSTAETFKTEPCSEPCRKCQGKLQITFFPKRKSWVHKEIAGRIGSIGINLKHHRLQACFCSRCHESYSRWVPDKHPFFRSAVKRRKYRKSIRRLGEKRYLIYYRSTEAIPELQVNWPVQPLPESAESLPP